VRIDKKGDFNIQAFDMKNDSENNYYIIYSDCIDTQIFKFSQSDIALKKLTKKVCFENQIPRLNASSFVKVYKDQYSHNLKAILIDADLRVSILNLETLKITQVADLSAIMTQQSKFRKYDRIFNFAVFNENTNLLVVNFMHDELMLIFKIEESMPVESSLYWSMPKLSSSTERPLALCLTFCPENENIVVAYDNNKIQVFDGLNKCLHSWSKQSADCFPSNFLNRYNRMVGCCALSAHKFILYTHYTYTILDISQPLMNIDGQAQVKITQDHPGKPLDYNSGWFECLKKS
jgi:hypothetical protein